MVLDSVNYYFFAAWNKCIQQENKKEKIYVSAVS